MKIVIGHLYPELLNLYGDRGNIAALVNRLVRRGIEAEVREYKKHDSILFGDLDIVFLGGGSDREQAIVSNRLREIKGFFCEYVEGGGVTLAICGGYQLMGNYYRLGKDMLDGLHIIDMITESGKGRLIGNVIIKSPLLEKPIVGFENHAGRTFLRGAETLGKTVCGNGNNGSDGGEGAVYKNVIGTYLHGPLLPKNPHLCDLVLARTLEKKYGGCHLAPLDDRLEMAANGFMIDRLKK